MSLPSLCHLPQGPLGAKAQEVPWSCKATRKNIFPTDEGRKPRTGKELSKGSVLRPTFANSEDGGGRVMAWLCKARRSGQTE